MIDLERSLAELAERLEIRGGDHLATDVVQRISQPERRRQPRRAITLAVALAVVAMIAIVALPGPRRVVARWLGFDSVRIEPGVTVPTTATSTPAATASSPLPASVGTTAAEPEPEPELGLGSAVSITDAMARTGLPDPSPAALGKAQAIHVVQPPNSGQIVLVYPPSELVGRSPVTGVGALVSVMAARMDGGFFQKTLGTSATVRSVDVGGADGFWIAGAPHQLYFVFDGEMETDTLRLATNTLLWQRGDHVYRLEADISLETALRIAASVP
jgi:hypothetical protein